MYTKHLPHFVAVLIMTAALAAPARAAQAPATAGASAGEARPYQGKEITDIADRMPFAYYPSLNKLEVAVQVPFMQVIPAECLVAAPGPDGKEAPGLRGDYYEGENFEKKVMSRVDPTVDFDWGNGSPDPLVPLDQFSIRWEGWVVPKDTGDHTFSTWSDDGARLWVDGKAVIDRWGPQSATMHSSPKIRLEAGKRYPVKMEYFERGFGACARLFWTQEIAVKAGESVAVRVVPVKGGQPVATGSLRLDAEGRGQDLIALPDLADGEYAVEYQIGGKTVKASHAFRRIHFPWENNQLGLGHKVYPPFTPVAVDGNTISVVDRAYAFNAFGLFDSVVSKGRELLAAPMAVVCETAEGREKWTPGGVQGEKKFDDLAVFSGRASCGALSVDSAVEVEEDGCAKVFMKLVPAAKPREIRKLWIEIPLKDQWH